MAPAARARAGILWAVAPELAPEPGEPGRSADRLVLFEALLDAVDEAAGDGTALWVLDDLHWADDSTWEFVQYAARRVTDLALVLATTYREEEIGPARRVPHELPRRIVGPVQVIQHPQRRPVPRGLIHRVQQRLEQHRPVRRLLWPARL